MQPLLNWIVALGLLLTSTTSWAADLKSESAAPQPKTRFELGLGVGMNIAPDRGQKFFTSSAAGWKLGVQARLSFRLGRRMYLGPVVGYTGHRHAVAGQLVDTHDSQLSLRELEGGLRLGGILHPGIELFSQVMAGPSFRRVRFAANSNLSGVAARFAEQRDVGFFADLQLGAALYFPQKWLRRGHVVPGTSVSFGYRFRPEIELEPTALSHSASGVSVRGPEFETINLSGLVWSWGLFVRFR